MSRPSRAALALLLASPGAAFAQTMPATTPATTTLPDLVVTGSREGENRLEVPNSISRIDQAEIDFIRPAHPSELLNRIPGVTIQQTNGEGSIVGIRQPVSTSPVYLYLQDNVPVQAAGFFNHNALYLLNVPQAAAIEVIRGPGTALQGSDAIGGVINVFTPAPTPVPFYAASVEAGSFGWVRGLGTYGNTIGNVGFRGDVNLTHTDGWRDRTSYDRQSVNLRADWQIAGDRRLVTTLNVGSIYQQTGANSTISYVDYVNRPTNNYLPIAFRRVQGLMLTSMYEQRFDAGLLTITPFFRANRMDLLASFTLRNDPSRYTTQYNSFGTQLRYRHDFDFWRTRVIGGIDLEYSPGSFSEDRVVPTVRLIGGNSYYTSYRRGTRLYDYDVAFSQASPYLHVETSPVENFRITGGLRFDGLSYNYRNNLANGAFNAAFVGPTGALTAATFYRPGNTDRYYHHLSPNLGFTYNFTPDFAVFAGYRQGFRLPQQGDLFRAGTNQDSIHLRPIVVDNFEAGLRSSSRGPFVWEVVAYHMVKVNDILSFTDNNRVPSQTNNGKTRHTGIEAAVSYRFSPSLRISGTYGYAEHEYLRWQTSPTSNLDGRRIPAAPHSTATLSVDYTPSWAPGLQLGLDFQHMGSYAMNAVANNSTAATQLYGGHNLLNLRADYLVHPNVRVFGRLMNVANTRWASSASVQGVNPVYAPGEPFRAFGGIAVSF